MRLEPTQAKGSQRTHQHRQQWETGDGIRAEFFLDQAPMSREALQVFVAGLLVRPREGISANVYTFDGKNTVTFTVAPGVGATVCFVVATV